MNRQKVKLTKKNGGIFQRTIVQKLNIRLAHVIEIIASLAYKMCVLDGHRITLHLKCREQDWKHVSNYVLAMKVRVMIFCRVLSQWTRVVCITMTWNCKAICFNIITPLLPKRKNLSLSLLLENTCSQFYGTTDILFTRSTWSKV